MLTVLSPLLIALAAVPYCPPETGQLRWDLRYEFKAQQPYAARGTVWDRDQTGTPSRGDLFRVEAAWRAGNPLPLDESWVVLGDALAAELAGAVAADKDVRITCESTVTIRQEPPVMATGAQLAQVLEAAAQPAQALEHESARMAQAMGKWAQEICAKTKYMPIADLTEALVAKAAKPFGPLGEARVRAAADTAARDGSVPCTRLSTGQISFD